MKKCLAALEKLITITINKDLPKKRRVQLEYLALACIMKNSCPADWGLAAKSDEVCGTHHSDKTLCCSCWRNTEFEAQE